MNESRFNVLSNRRADRARPAMPVLWSATVLHTLALALALSQGRLSAAVFAENFATDPTTRRWCVFGEASLFVWNASSERLEVTWDSSRSNSYFYHLLEAPLTKTHDFSLSFDLRLFDILGGARPGHPGPFEIAIGFFNTANATNAGFVRGKVSQFPNLCEFDYFPQGSNPPPYGIIAATVSPMISSISGAPATTMNFPLEMPPNDWFHVQIHYTASNRTLRTTMTRNGEPFGPILPVVLGSGFSDFRLDAVSISSYSDAGDRYGSVLAHGEVDNLVVVTPDPPWLALSGAFSNRVWHVRFLGHPDWLYALERTTDLTNWRTVSTWTPGSDGAMALAETNQAGTASAFYRVRLQNRSLVSVP